MSPKRKRPDKGKEPAHDRESGPGRAERAEANPENHGQEDPSEIPTGSLPKVKMGRPRKDVPPEEREAMNKRNATNNLSRQRRAWLKDPENQGKTPTGKVAYRERGRPRKYKDIDPTHGETPTYAYPDRKYLPPGEREARNRKNATNRRSRQRKALLEDPENQGKAPTGNLAYRKRGRPPKAKDPTPQLYDEAGPSQGGHSPQRQPAQIGQDDLGEPLYDRSARQPSAGSEMDATDLGLSDEQVASMMAFLAEDPSSNHAIDAGQLPPQPDPNLDLGLSDEQVASMMAFLAEDPSSNHAIDAGQLPPQPDPQGHEDRVHQVEQERRELRKKQSAELGHTHDDNGFNL
jgi:hypothetical protein